HRTEAEIMPTLVRNARLETQVGGPGECWPGWKRTGAADGPSTWTRRSRSRICDWWSRTRTELMRRGWWRFARIRRDRTCGVITYWRDRVCGGITYLA